MGPMDNCDVIRDEHLHHLADELSWVVVAEHLLGPVIEEQYETIVDDDGRRVIAADTPSTATRRRLEERSSRRYGLLLGLSRSHPNATGTDMAPQGR